MSYEETQQLFEMLRELHQKIDLLTLNSTASKDYYTTQEFAQLVGLSEFTVREHCRHHRLHASKKLSGRGASCAWAIGHEELLRYQREGLLPDKSVEI